MSCLLWVLESFRHGNVSSEAPVGELARVLVPEGCPCHLNSGAAGPSLPEPPSSGANWLGRSILEAKSIGSVL